MGSAGRVFLRRPLMAAIAALLLVDATQAATADPETAARFDMVRKIEVIARESSGGATPTTLNAGVLEAMRRAQRHAFEGRRPCGSTDSTAAPDPKQGLLSARQWRQGRIRREAEYRRRMEILPRLQLRARKVRLVGAVGEMLRLERKRLGLAVRRAG